MAMEGRKQEAVMVRDGDERIQEEQETIDRVTSRVVTRGPGSGRGNSGGGRGRGKGHVRGLNELQWNINSPQPNTQFPDFVE